MAAGDRMPHALLFLGPPGAAKLALALATAQYVLCQQKGESDACGRCPACVKAEKYLHPDLHFTFPTIGTNALSDHFLPQWRSLLAQNTSFDAYTWLQTIGAENKQGNINREECLQIVRKLSLTSFESDYKIWIIWMPEYLGKEGNRLLKIIEEPPAKSLFLLVAEDTEQILPTILSRCQLIKVPPFSDEEITATLTEQYKVPAERARSIAFLADGNLQEALHMTEKMENDQSNMFLDWLRKCYRGNGVDLVKWTDQWAKLGREQQKHLLHYALHFLREFLQLKINPEAMLRLQEDEYKTAVNLSQVLAEDQIAQMHQLIGDRIYHIERNANPKVSGLDLSIKMHKIFKRQLEKTD